MSTQRESGELRLQEGTNCLIPIVLVADVISKGEGLLMIQSRLCCRLCASSPIVRLSVYNYYVKTQLNSIKTTVTQIGTLLPRIYSRYHVFLSLCNCRSYSCCLLRSTLRPPVFALMVYCTTPASAPSTRGSAFERYQWDCVTNELWQRVPFQRSGTNLVANRHQERFWHV